jgi:radical SAM superfamily enzyme YgiQ (UPF0313 family)
MDTALVNISLRPRSPVAPYPVGLAYVVTAMCRAGFTFDVIDLEIHPELDINEELGRKKYDIVAFGTLVSGYRQARDVAAAARQLNSDVTVIAGNSVASSVPELLLRKTEVDVVVKGEGDNTIVSLVRAVIESDSLYGVPGIMFFDGKTLIDTGHADVIKDVDSIPGPDWDLFEIEQYIDQSHFAAPTAHPTPNGEIRSIYVTGARGCPFHCTFCYHVFNYTGYRRRSAESLLHEIEFYQRKYDVNDVRFSDELTFPNRYTFGAFVDLVLERRLAFTWTAICRGDIFRVRRDVPLLRRAREAGCVGIGYSLESANPGILETMNKKLAVEDFCRQKRAVDRAGLVSFTSVVVGYPQETLETIQETFDVCYELDFYPSVGYLLPQPGTFMFDEARKMGKISNVEGYLLRMGDRQDLHVNLTSMSDSEMTGAVEYHLGRIAKKLGLHLPNGQLLKTRAHIGSSLAVENS